MSHCQAIFTQALCVAVVLLRDVPPPVVQLEMSWLCVTVWNLLLTALDCMCSEDGWTVSWHSDVYSPVGYIELILASSSCAFTRSTIHQKLSITHLMFVLTLTVGLSPLH